MNGKPKLMKGPIIKEYYLWLRSYNILSHAGGTS